MIKASVTSDKYIVIYTLITRWVKTSFRFCRKHSNPRLALLFFSKGQHLHEREKDTAVYLRFDGFEVCF